MIPFIFSGLGINKVNSNSVSNMSDLISFSVINFILSVGIKGVIRVCKILQNKA